MEMTRVELAEHIASLLDCTTKVWSKGDKVRVYLSHRGKEYGFVEVTKQGLEYSLTGYANNTYKKAIKAAAEDITIIEPLIEANGVRRLTQSEADKIAYAQRQDKRGDTDAALDAMYGRGNWDRWDREDYEG